MGSGERVAETACVRAADVLASQGNDASPLLTSQGEMRKIYVVARLRLCSPISVFFRM